MKSIRHHRSLIVCLMVSLALGPLAAMAATVAGTTELVSVTSSGDQGNGISGRFAAAGLSADGLVAGWDSEATNLVTGDTNIRVDVFVHDRTSDMTEGVSVSSAEVQGNDDSTLGDLDEDGTLVVFSSEATNLVAGDTNGDDDVFLRDRSAGTTERVSISSAGVQGAGGSFGPHVTPDGSFVVFSSTASNLVAGDANGTTDIFLRDRTAGTTERVSVGNGGVEGNGFAGGSAITPDGRFVAFVSFASNLTAGDTNGQVDLFIRDRSTGTTELVSITSSGVVGDNLSAGPSISADGRFVAFYSDASNLVPGDTNATRDVFVRDRTTGTTERVNVDDAGGEANAQSAFSVHGGSSEPEISDDGRYVSFDSFATDLVSDDTNNSIDVFVRDREAATTARISVDTAGAEADDDSSDSAISADGLVVAFISLASNLVAGDTNVCGTFVEPGECPDIFVRDMRSNGTTCTLTGTAGVDVLTGTAGADVICGLAGNDTISGLEGNDTLLGGDGNDTLTGGAGNDTINGEAGSDTAGFAAAPGAVTVDLAAGTATGNGTDTLTAMENILGSAFADTLAGTTGGNRFTAGAGADTVNAGAGRDTLNGQGGNDVLNGQDGNDTLNGQNGNDTLDGGAGTDTLAGGAGTDSCLNGETLSTCE